MIYSAAVKTLLSSLKISLRISPANHLYDDEISRLADAALCELEKTGIIISNPENDSIISAAIVTYCKANFGVDDPEVAKNFMEAFEIQKRKMALYANYRTD